MKLRLIVEDETSWKKWCAEQKPLLSAYPEYASRIPANLKAKAAKYLPTAPGADSSATASAGGAASTAGVSLR